MEVQLPKLGYGHVQNQFLPLDLGLVVYNGPRRATFDESPSIGFDRRQPSKDGQFVGIHHFQLPVTKGQGAPPIRPTLSR